MCGESPRVKATPSIRQLRASAPANVVVLPTAASRQVDNHRYAEQRRAGRAAKDASPFKQRYRHHQDREADALAAELASIEQTPALLIVSAMVRALDSEAATRLLEQLAGGAVVGHKPAIQAVATIKASRLNLGQKFDLLRAQERLREGR